MLDSATCDITVIEKIARYFYIINKMGGFIYFFPISSNKMCEARDAIGLDFYYQMLRTKGTNISMRSITYL